MTKKVLGIEAPEKTGDDKNCPFHGQINVKKELLEGVIIKKDTHRSATIEWFRPFYVPKYERFEVRRSRLRIHNPASLNAEVGDRVLVARTRPISKTKNHVAIKILERGVQ